MDTQTLNDMFAALPDEWEIFKRTEPGAPSVQQEHKEYLHRTYNLDGLLHDEHGPAFHRAGVYISSNGYKDLRSRREEWHVNGQLHRESDKPAVISFGGWGTTGLVTIEYYQRGVLHRENGPAFIEITPAGKLVKVAYYQNGQLHRQHGPALIEYDYVSAQDLTKSYKTKNSSEIQPAITAMSYYQNGMLHCEHGPALLKWSLDEDRKFTFENDLGFKYMDWYVHGRRVSKDPSGVVQVHRRDDGSVSFETFAKDRREAPSTPWGTYFAPAPEGQLVGLI